MSHPPTTAATDGTLVSQVALGDPSAFDAIVARHHGAVAVLARLIAPPSRRKALVAETFEVTHTTLRLRLGPSELLRPFLLMTARHLSENHPTGPARTDHPLNAVPFRDARPGAMHPAVTAEFSRLPEAWQLLVWHLEVEGESPEEAAALVGVSPVVVPALVEGARAALRRALLLRHRARTLPAQCLGYTLRLERSGGVHPPRVMLRHTAGCERCAVLLGDLDAVERDLGEAVARHLLGWAAEGYLAARRAGATGFAEASRIVGR